MPQPSMLLQPFNYQGVSLAPSRWQRQMLDARAFYLGVPDDDILHGFRRAAGQPAPGQPLGGWCHENSNTVFGQWLSGMSRMSRALGDDALRRKAVGLFEGWAATLGADGDARMPHYAFDKLVGGLVDLAQFGGHAAALPVLQRVVAHAMRNLDKTNRMADPASPIEYQGAPHEWYTLAENLLLAHVHTGDDAFREHAKTWLYHEYWNQFASDSNPPHAHGVHAYSHVNTFSSAMLAYAVLDDARYLHCAEHAAAYVQAHQAYATGGYGPNERFVPMDGSLGRALDTRSDTCEVSCCTWAGFKLARYLMQYTAQARHGDWIEQLLYNGIGAALPIAGGGRAFYYGDYRVGGGMKVYNWETFTCCSGTYIQNVSEYHNLIAFHDARGVYINLYLPATITWPGAAGTVRIEQRTAYPNDGRIVLSITTPKPVDMSLGLRVPAWARDFAVQVNGSRVEFTRNAGGWAMVERVWRTGDTVEISMQLPLRMLPVDAQHPNRVAVMRGPTVLVLEGAYHDAAFRLPPDAAGLERWLQPELAGRPRGVHGGYTDQPDPPTVYRVDPPDGPPARLRFRPFYEIGEGYPYFMYFDRETLPWKLW